MTDPSKSTSLTTTSTSSNILSITVASICLPFGSSSISLTESEPSTQAIISTSADRSLRIYSSDTYTLLRTIPSLHNGPILSVLPISQRWLVTGSMVGDICVSTLSGDVIQKVDAHEKYVVKL